MTHEEIDFQLIKDLKRGSQKSFDELYEIYNHKLFCYALSITNNKAIADEVVQNTFIQVINKIHQVKEVEKFESWMFRIAHNFCLQEMRKDKNRKEDSLDLKEEISGPLKSEGSDDISNNIIMEEVLHSMSTLSKKNQEIIMYKLILEMSEEEISNTLNIPKGTIKSRFNQAKKMLQKSLVQNGCSPQTMLALASPGMLKGLFVAIDQGSKSKVYQVGLQRLSQKFLIKQMVVAGIGVGVVGAGAGIAYYNWPTPQEEPVQPEIVEVVPVVEVCKINSVDYNQEFTNKEININAEVDCGENYTLKLNDQDILTAYENGTYRLTLSKNGELIEERELIVGNIDREMPILVSNSFNSPIYSFTVSDGISGIDPNIIYLKNGVESTGFTFNEATSTVSFEFDFESTHEFLIRDRAGNQITINVEL